MELEERIKRLAQLDCCDGGGYPDIQIVDVVVMQISE